MATTTTCFVVPDNYDPARSYPVRVQLHGGVNRPQAPDSSRLGVARLPVTVEEIEVFPAAWANSLWWQASQVDNLSKILDKLKRTYNVDENRVYLTGISDGGTGVFHGVSRHHALGELSAAQRQHDGACHARSGRRRPDVPGQRRQQAIFCGQWRPRSPLSGAHRRALCRAPDAPRRRRGVPREGRVGSQHRLVAGGTRRLRSVCRRPSARSPP